MKLAAGLGLIVAVTLGIGAALGIAVGGDRALAQPAPSPSPSASPSVRYRADFAPIRICPGERETFVNPAMVVRMDPAPSTEDATRLTLADGETVRACGSLLEVAKVLRVSVWLEDRQ